MKKNLLTIIVSAVLAAIFVLILVSTNTDHVITFDLQHNATDDFIRQQAEAIIKLELTASARAAAFTNQIPAYNAAPSVYVQRLYAQTFPRAVANARKYILVSTNTDHVITFDLQHNATDDFIRQQAEAINKPN